MTKHQELLAFGAQTRTSCRVGQSTQSLPRSLRATLDEGIIARPEQEQRTLRVCMPDVAGGPQGGPPRCGPHRPQTALNKYLDVLTRSLTSRTCRTQRPSYLWTWDRHINLRPPLCIIRPELLRNFSLSIPETACGSQRRDRTERRDGGDLTATPTSAGREESGRKSRMELLQAYGLVPPKT